jgi:cytochrome c553
MTLKQILVLVSVALGAAAFAAAGARADGDALAGRKIVQSSCSACHGMDGIAVLPEAANLAGQDAGYLKRQLAAFKDGSRKNEQMAVFSGQLNDQQMEDVATYFSQIEIKVVKVPGKK